MIAQLHNSKPVELMKRCVVDNDLQTEKAHKMYAHSPYTYSVVSEVITLLVVLRLAGLGSVELDNCEPYWFSSCILGTILF